MTNRKKYSLIQDDSCHWYIVPIEKREEFIEYIDTVADYDYNSEDLYPQEPEWAKRIDGPESLILLDWEEV